MSMNKTGGGRLVPRFEAQDSHNDSCTVMYEMKHPSITVERAKTEGRRREGVEVLTCLHVHGDDISEVETVDLASKNIHG